MSSPRTQFSDKKNVAYEVNPRMVVFSHESSIGDNQVIMRLGIQAHGDDDCSIVFCYITFCCIFSA